LNRNLIVTCIFKKVCNFTIQKQEFNRYNTYMVVIEKNRLNVKNEKIRYNKMTIPSVIVQKRYRNNFWKLKFVKVVFFFFFY
jgi:hypothetical protein